MRKAGSYIAQKCLLRKAIEVVFSQMFRTSAVLVAFVCISLVALHVDSLGIAFARSLRQRTTQLFGEVEVKNLGDNR